MQHPAVLDVRSHTNDLFSVFPELLSKNVDLLFGLETQIPYEQSSGYQKANQHACDL